jgi:hypothetical protein
MLSNIGTKNTILKNRKLRIIFNGESLFVEGEEKQE